MAAAVYVLSPRAEEDIAAILAWTDEHFGRAARRRYEALLVQAILDVAADPERPGATTRPEIAADARTYHLWHSRRRVSARVGRVQTPRHFLLFRVAGERIEIGRVLHDSMDLPRHLPPEYRPQ